MNAVTPGGRLLKVSSIIVIIFSVIPFFLIIWPALRLVATFGIDFGFLLMAGEFTFTIYVHIMGLIHCNNLEKASLLWKLGIARIIMIAATFLAFVIAFVIASGNISVLSLLGFVLAFILSISYTVGASRNMEAADEWTRVVWECAECGEINRVHTSRCVSCKAFRVR